jgi:hypothetical protein
MKDRRTNLTHKAEHAVDLNSGAALAAMQRAEVQTYIPEPECGRHNWYN